MAESIKGSSSSLYIKDEVPSVTNSADTMNHLSVQNLWGARGAADTLVHGVHRNTTLPVLIEAGSVKRKIKITGHGAIAGDFLKMNNGSADGEEVSILKVIDADNFIISKEINASIGDEAFILKPVTQRLAKDGGLQISQGPIQYNDNQVGTPVEVTMDTAVPANIKALPTELIFKKDGVNKRVSYDSTTPTNSDAIPVNIVTVNGTGIQTTVDLAGAQVNVQLSHNASNPDSVKIGDGTDLLQISTDGEALVVVNKELPEGTKKIGKIVITDGVDDAEIKSLTTGLSDADKGLITQSVLHGHYSSGGGGWVDIKATQSGALETNVNGNTNVGTDLTAAANIDVVKVGGLDQDTKVQTLRFNGSEVLAKVTGAVTVSGNVGVTGNVTVSQSTADNLRSTVDLQGIAKGTTAANKATVSVFDADHNGLDTVVKDFDAGLKATSGSNTKLGVIELSSVSDTPFSTKVITYNAQSVSGLSNYYAKVAASIIHGWDSASSVHKEISVSPTGQVNTTTTQQTVAGTITNAQITVGLTAVRATVSGSAPNAARKKLMIKPSASNTGKIFLGSSSVTIANGLEIIGPDRLEFEFDSGDYYLISDTAAQVVEIIEKA